MPDASRLGTSHRSNRLRRERGKRPGSAIRRTWSDKLHSRNTESDIHFDDINEEIHIVFILWTYCVTLVTVPCDELKLFERTVADLMRNWATYNPSEVGEL